jgi:16S rRNA (cytosine1402-N4)-methyltransferase
MNNSFTHEPVMTAEVIEHLAVIPGNLYLDCTLGAGGHAAAIIKQGGQVIGIDRDPLAIEICRQKLDSRFVTLIHGSFKELKQLVQPHLTQPVAGILFDYGVSSMQLDNANRGFSFKADAPLDMRMDPAETITAAKIINSYTKEELYALLTTLAQENRARAISEAIVRAREVAPITGTKQLAQIVASVYTGTYTHLHPATKTFQALRITVNQELSQIQAALTQAVDLLAQNGRLVTMSFHEGEDRIVKQIFKKQHRLGVISILTKTPLTPTDTEIATNPRARSARLRAAKKL